MTLSLQGSMTLLLVCLTGVACQAETGVMQDKYVTAAQLDTDIRTGSSPKIIDVRSSREYRAGHVPGAIHIPFWKAFTRAGKIQGDRAAPLVVYCAHGPRAGIGKAAFKLAGFSDVRYLKGHMTGWYKAGLPVEKGTAE